MGLKITKDQERPYHDWSAFVVVAAFSVGLTAALTFVIGHRHLPINHLLIMSLVSAAPLPIAMALSARIFRQHFLAPLHDATQELFNNQNMNSITPSPVAALAICEFIEAHNHRIARSKTLYEEDAYLCQRNAVSHMTQMLAHDVRKPFSILRMGLSLLSSAQDPVGIQNILSRLVPETEKAMNHVDSLISDIMEVDAPSRANSREILSPQLLIEDAVSEIGRIFPRAVIGITYDLQHKYNVLANAQKSRRVFVNILINAVQATGRDFGKSGHIWIKTRDIDQFVEFCIANSGSQIPLANLSRIFDAFFTSGKKTGTGLGLAIAQKVVTEHGGQIWCRSHATAEYPTGLVEFYFTLPVTENKKAEMTLRPLQKRALSNDEGMLFAPNVSTYETQTEDTTVLNETLISSTRLTHKQSYGLDQPSPNQPEVAVVEDNPFILDAWVETLSQDAKVHTASSPEAMSQLLFDDPDLLNRLACVVTDLHFDNSPMNGVDVGKKLKKDRPNLPTLLSSDGWISQEEMTGSIDHVIPKEPMTYRRLKEFFRSSSPGSGKASS